MRLLCTGDLHFGAGTKYSDDRLGEQEVLWAEILGLADGHGVDALIVAGDIWHRPRPTPAEYLAFTRPMASAAVDVLACPGNHDYLAAGQPTGLDVPATRGLYVTSKPKVQYLKAGKIGWLPWTPPHHLIAANPGIGRDDLNRMVAEQLVLAAKALVADGAEVLVAHWAVSGALLPSGELVQSIMREPILNAHDLADLGVPVVLGHIHCHQTVAMSDEASVFYVGSPMPLDFGEGGYEHGVVLLDTDGTPAVREFIPLESRPFLTIDHRESPAAADALAFAASNGIDFQLDANAGAIVRLRYTATPEQQGQIDTAKLVRQFEAAGASRVYILPEIVKATRSRVELEDDTGPLDALRAWLEAQGHEEGDDLVGLTSELLGEVGA